jgi:hypothetical protein
MFDRLMFKKKVDFKKSYSQSGEDLIVKYIIDWLCLENISYLDIGAFDPININNTYLFYLHGYKGVNIDGNPISINKFDKVRGRDKNILALVSASTESKTYFEFDVPVLNTIDELFAQKVLQEGIYKLKKETKIETIGINDILNTYFPHKHSLSFLSLDVEGMDFEILNAIDFDNFFPSIICVETVEFKNKGLGEKNTEIMSLLQSKGYYLYADTYINSIFVNLKLF